MSYDITCGVCQTLANYQDAPPVHCRACGAMLSRPLPEEVRGGEAAITPKRRPESGITLPPRAKNPFARITLPPPAKNPFRRHHTRKRRWLRWHIIVTVLLWLNIAIWSFCGGFAFVMRLAPSRYKYQWLVESVQIVTGLLIAVLAIVHLFLTWKRKKIALSLLALCLGIFIGLHVEDAGRWVALSIKEHLIIPDRSPPPFVITVTSDPPSSGKERK